MKTKYRRPRGKVYQGECVCQTPLYATSPDGRLASVSRTCPTCGKTVLLPRRKDLDS